MFFAARCERGAPQLIGVTEDEIQLMQEARWWSLDELKATGERVFPVEIVRVASEAYARVGAHK